MKICYFGIYNREESRNKIYITGLRSLGVEIIECRDDTRGLLKYIRLFFKHWKVRNSYEYMIVGYPGHVVVPFAKMISGKPVILDALCSLYEGVIISRGRNGLFFFREKYIRFVDKLAIRYADILLVETVKQKEFFEQKLHAPRGKVKTVYTGASDAEFYPDNSVEKKSTFTAVFRGKFLPEAGVTHIIRTAKLLEESQVNFLIIGGGFLKKEIETLVKELKPKNVEFMEGFRSFENIRNNMLSCHVSLGQFERHKRLSRTIPHKCFESLALGLPYITAKAEGVEEILTDTENCLFVEPGHPEDLAEKIILLKNNSILREKIARAGYDIYQKKFTPKVLAEEILRIIAQTKNPRK